VEKREEPRRAGAKVLPEEVAALTAFPVESMLGGVLDEWQQGELLKWVSRGRSPIVACHHLGVSITSFLKTIECESAFAERVSQAQIALSQNVASQLYRTAMEGNVSAQKCYLEFRPPPEWGSASSTISEDEELDPHELAEGYRAAGMAVPTIPAIPPVIHRILTDALHSRQQRCAV